MYNMYIFQGSFVSWLLGGVEGWKGIQVLGLVGLNDCVGGAGGGGGVKSGKLGIQVLGLGRVNGGGSGDGGIFEGGK